MRFSLHVITKIMGHYKGEFILLFSTISCTQLVLFTTSFFSLPASRISAALLYVCAYSRKGSNMKRMICNVTLSSDQRRINLGFVDERLSRSESDKCKNKPVKPPILPDHKFFSIEKSLTNHRRTLLLDPMQRLQYVTATKTAIDTHASPHMRHGSISIRRRLFTPNLVKFDARVARSHNQTAFCTCPSCIPGRTFSCRRSAGVFTGSGAVGPARKPDSPESTLFAVLRYANNTLACWPREDSHANRMIRLGETKCCSNLPASSAPHQTRDL